MSLALQAADAIKFLAMNGHIHGDVSAHNISYQGGKATLIDLATLRSIDQVPQACIVAICCKKALIVYFSAQLHKLCNVGTAASL